MRLVSGIRNNCADAMLALVLQKMDIEDASLMQATFRTLIVQYLWGVGRVARLVAARPTPGYRCK